jgi:putative Holliday junction resolvase
MNNDIESFKNSLPAEGRLLAIDLGMKRIGTAITDTKRIISTPYEVIERVNIKKDINKIVHIINQQEIVGLVMGYPLKLDGTESSLCLTVSSFAKKLLFFKNLPILYQDERMSSVSAGRVMGEYGLSVNTKSKIEDKIAASFILQASLDRMDLFQA